MSNDEWNRWAVALIVPFVCFVFFAGISIGAGVVEPALVTGVVFGTAFVPWLFRATYVAGKRRGDT